MQKNKTSKKGRKHRKKKLQRRGEDIAKKHQKNKLQRRGDDIAKKNPKNKLQRRGEDIAKKHQKNKLQRRGGRHHNFFSRVGQRSSQTKLRFSRGNIATKATPFAVLLSHKKPPCHCCLTCLTPGCLWRGIGEDQDPRRWGGAAILNTTLPPPLVLQHNRAAVQAILTFR